MKMKKDKYLKKKIWMCILGTLISGISVGFFKRALFGVDPFQSFMAGLDTLVPISFGTLYVIANVVLLLFALILDRHYIGISTFINLFLLGYVVQFSQSILQKLLPDLGIPGRVVCLAVGLAVMCIAASLYFTADLGVSTYDAVALILTNKFHIGKFRYLRILTDVVCVGCGILLYLLSGAKPAGLTAVAGIGTVITAFFMGPLIDLFNIRISQPLLYGRSARHPSPQK